MKELMITNLDCKKFILAIAGFFVTSVAFAECTKEELLKFIDLGLTKEEVTEICNKGKSNLAIDETKEEKEEKEETEGSESFLNKMTFGVFEKDEKPEEEERQEEADAKEEVEMNETTSELKEENIKNLQHQFFFEFGGMGGEYQFRSESETTREFSNELNHDLSGGIFTLGYQYKFDSGMTVGVGYQNYNLSGESERITKEFTASDGITKYDLGIMIMTDELSGRGILGIVGYTTNILGSLELSPQLRIGIANEIKLRRKIYFYSSVDVEGNGEPLLGEQSESLTSVGIALPIIYRFNEFGIGLTIYGFSVGFEDEGDDYREEASTSSGSLIHLSNKF